MTPVSAVRRLLPDPGPLLSPVRRLVAATEIDTRLAGMLVALAIIWIGFNIVSGGLFLTPRNLWFLSVQTAVIAIMATGMVLVIVSREIDLSVGSSLGFIGYAMAMLQSEWIPNSLGLGYEQPYTWIVTVIFGLALGALIGGIHGWTIAYVGVPSFIVTLGGLLIWRGLIFRFNQGQTVAPLDPTFELLGGGPEGSLGEAGSYALGLLACLVIAFSVITTNRRRRRYGFPERPRWAQVAVVVAGVIAVMGFVWVMNQYPWPRNLATQYAQAHGIQEPPGGLIIPTGIAFPVLITIGVTLLVTFVATRRKFGRYVYSIGGNPEAAKLAGINVRRTIVGTFVLMGILVAVAAIVQTARLKAAVTGLGTGFELDVIAAAVVGGSSFAGGIGTIPGAVLGAVVLQSLRSGMVLVGLESTAQDIVIGLVLVAAVGLDNFFRRRNPS